MFTKPREARKHQELDHQMQTDSLCGDVQAFTAHFLGVPGSVPGTCPPMTLGRGNSPDLPKGGQGAHTGREKTPRLTAQKRDGRHSEVRGLLSGRESNDYLPDAPLPSPVFLHSRLGPG